VISVSSGGRIAGDAGAGGATIGVVGGTWRATVTPWGAVVPRDGAPLDWAVAGDERWHFPRAERSVRQTLLRGVPVVETRMRVGGGEAVHRTYAVADGDGLTVVEVENRSVQPFAVAFTRRDVRTTRPIPDVPIVGVELPPGSWVAPVGHRASVRIALAHHLPSAGPLPQGLPTPEQVARGWEQQVAVGARFDGAAEADVPVAQWRAALLLDGAGDPADDPARYLLAARELTELGVDPRPMVDAVAGALEWVGRRQRGADAVPWDVDAAAEAAWQVLRAAGERRGATDAVKLRRALAPAASPPPDPPTGPVALGWLRWKLAADDRHGAIDLLPAPLPAPWIGHDLEAHGLRVGNATISLAVRWHGSRPALLWEAHGVRRLACSGLDRGWSTDRPAGDALLAGS
jgi:hypothetical protein